MTNSLAIGTCLCKKIEIKATQPSTHAHACHCGICRKWGGGPFFSVECKNGVEVKGEDNLAIYDSSEWAERGFCKACGTHLFYKFKGQTHYMIPVDFFDNLGGVDFASQIFIDKKPSYYSFENKTEMLTEAQVIAAHQPEGV